MSVATEAHAACRVLVPGASGLLGANLVDALALAGLQPEGVARGRPARPAAAGWRRSDLTTRDSCQSILDAVRPSAVVNCAAMASLESCEAEPQLAEAANVVLPALLAEACRQRAVPFVHISTDAVFDGRSGPYSEGAEPAPRSVYARTKRAGEERVLTVNPQSLVLRVNFFGWSPSGSRSLAEFFHSALLEGREVRGFDDVLFTPLYVQDLVDVILASLTKGLSGLWHAGGSQQLSKYAFGRSLASEFGLDERLLLRGALSGKRTGVDRNGDLRLDSSRLARTLGVQLPSASGGLRRMNEDLEGGRRARLRVLLSAP